MANDFDARLQSLMSNPGSPGVVTTTPQPSNDSFSLRLNSLMGGNQVPQEPSLISKVKTAITPVTNFIKANPTPISAVQNFLARPESAGITTPLAKLQQTSFNFIDQAFKLVDRSITGVQDYLAKPENVKVTELLAKVQKYPTPVDYFLKREDPIWESNPVTRGIQKGVMDTYLGSSQKVAETFKKPIDIDPKLFGNETAGDVAYTVGGVIGTIASYVAGGAAFKAAGFAQATLPALFVTLGQTSAVTNTTVTQRIQKAPVDAITGWLFSKIPAPEKILSPEMLKTTGAATGIASAQAFINSLIEGMDPKEAALTAAKMGVIGGLFHIAGTATGLFTNKLIASRFKEGKIELTPDELRGQVINSNLENTPLGKDLIKVSLEADQMGKNVVVSGMAAKKSAVAKIINAKTPEGLQIQVELVEPGQTQQRLTDKTKAPETKPVSTEGRVVTQEGSKKGEAITQADTGLPSNSIVAPSEPSPGLETNSPPTLTKTLSPAGADKSTRYVSPSQLYNLAEESDIYSNYSKISKISQSNEKVFAEDIKNATGIEPSVRVKSEESFTGKVKRYQLRGKDPATISDVLAARVIVKPEEVYTQLENLQKNFEVTEVNDYFETKTAWGYSGINVTVKLPNGQYSEIQLHTPESRAVAHDMHKLYEKWRNVDINRISEEEIKQYLADREASNKLSQNITSPAKKTETPDVGELEIQLKNKLSQKPEEVQQAVSEIMAELEIAEAGKRIFIENEGSSDATVIGVKSTFPQWVPEDLRDKKLFDKVVSQLISIADNPKYPAGGKKLRELYNELLGEVGYRSGVDLTDVQNSIMEAYERQEKATTGIRGGIAGAKGTGDQSAEANSAKKALTPQTDTNIAQTPPLSPTGQSEAKQPQKAVDMGGVGERSIQQHNNQLVDKNKLKTADNLGGEKNGTILHPDTTGDISRATGGQKIGEFETAEAGVKTENFKLFEKIKTLTEKYVKIIGKGTLGEGYTPRGAIGSFYNDTGNVRINGMNNLSVAAHEDAHLLDRAYKISDNILSGSETSTLRREMTELYEKYYPGGSKTHKLEKRIVEGFATLLQKFVEMPSTTNKEFPTLVSEFLLPGGKYYNPVVGEMVKDLKQIVSEYQGLSALDKIGARITDKNPEQKKQFLNLFEKVRTFIEDEIYPVEKVAKVSGTHFTTADPSLWLRSYSSGGGIYANNILSDRGYWNFKEGEFRKLHDFNWHSLTKQLQKDKIQDSFGSYLVSRASYFDHQELKRLKEVVAKKQQIIDDLGKDNAVQITNKEGNTPLDDLKAAQAEYKRLKEIIDRDGFTEEEVTAAYQENKSRFAEEEKMFDTLVREDLNLLHQPEVGLVDKDLYDKLTAKEGYATRKRQFYDELVGDEEATYGTGRLTTKASFLKGRTGSSRAILDPIASSMKNHIEAVKKATRQMVYNKIANIAISAAVPDMFQKVQLEPLPDSSGRITYPQERDPKIIMGRVDYKRTPILTDALIKSTIDNTLTYQAMNIFEQLLVTSSRLFTAGTTGMYPPFALRNFTADQLNAIVNSRNQYTPVLEQLRILGGMLNRKGGDVAKYWQEWEVLGGNRMTLSNSLALSPEEFTKKVIDEKKALEKVFSYLNKGIDIFSIPANFSEQLTRFGEYYKSRKAGKAQVVALEEAGRVSAPFHHLGSWRVRGVSGKYMIKAMPFGNASLQTAAQIIRTGMESNGGRRRILFAMLALTALYLSSAASVSLFGSEDQKEQYKDIKPNELGMFLHFPMIGGKGLVTVRVSQELSIIGTLAAMKLNESLFNVKYKFTDYVNALGTVLPRQMDITEPAAMFLSWFAPIVKIPFELIAGIKDYPHVRPLESQSLQNVPPGERSNEGTSNIAKRIGKLTNISPIKIDFLVTGLLGRYTGYFTAKPGIYSIQSAFLRDYYFTMGRRIENFYDRYTAVQQKKNVIETLPGEERLKVAQEYSKLSRINDLLKQYRKIDLEKEQKRSVQVRSLIINLLDEL